MIEISAYFLASVATALSMEEVGRAEYGFEFLSHKLLVLSQYPVV
jgi:hypothetical protein